MNARRVYSEREVAISNPTNSWPAESVARELRRVLDRFLGFSSLAKATMHCWLSSSGLNFDRLSQRRDRRRWHNNDRPDCAAAAFLRGSPAFLGTPADTF